MAIIASHIFALRNGLIFKIKLRENVFNFVNEGTSNMSAEFPLVTISAFSGDSWQNVLIVSDISAVLISIPLGLSFSSSSIELPILWMMYSNFSFLYVKISDLELIQSMKVAFCDSTGFIS